MEQAVWMVEDLDPGPAFYAEVSLVVRMIRVALDTHGATVLDMDLDAAAPLAEKTA
jgi:hypothetical protein